MQGKNEPNLGAIVAGAMLALSRSVIAKVEFPNDSVELKGFGVLCGSGHVMECYEGRIYGVTTTQQLDLLNKNNIPYKRIE